MQTYDPAQATIFADDSLIPAADRLPGPVDQTEYLVDGEIRTWSGPSTPVQSPIGLRTPAGTVSRVIGSHPRLTSAQALDALDAAVRAHGSGRGDWPTMSVSGRIACMERFVSGMTAVREEVVRLLMWEIAKTREDAAKEFDRTVQYARDTMDALKDLDRASSRFVIEQGIIGQIRRSPLGVVLCMGPFNYPLNETFTLLIPALIMGNTAVIKPPRLGVLLYRPLLEAFRQAFPRGVVNTVYGDGREVAGPLMESGRVDLLAFIGTSKAGDILKKLHPRPHRLRCVLGLEAKNAAIVLDDADLDLTVRELVLGCLSYNGQRCTALKLVFAHRRIVDDLLARLGRAITGLKAGMPWDPGVGLTPLAEPDKTRAMAELVEDAVSRGARVVNEGGARIDHTYFHPAIVHPVDERMRLWREEQFGPVVPISTFDDIETPIRYVVESNYGQQVSLFGRSPDTIARLIDPLVNQVCRVNINSQCQRGPDTFPFTGRKDSAEGTLSVSDALRVFSIRSLVAAKGSEANKAIITDVVRGRKSNFLSTDFIL